MAAPTILLSVISSVVTVATAIYSTKLADADPTDTGADVTKTGTSATRNPVYGRCRVSTVNVYNNVNNSANEWLLSVFGFGIGPLTAVHQVYIDDVPALLDGNYVTNPAGGTGQLTFDAAGDFQNQNVKVQLRSGISNEVPMQLAIDNSDGEWTNQHKGDGVGQCAILVRRVIDDEGARILAPQFTVSVDVSGAALYDPRIGSHNVDDPSTWSFSENPALALLDYITNTYYGMGIPKNYIDYSTFVDAANYCDAYLYKIASEVNSANSFSDIINKILACFGGILIAENGFVRVKYEEPVTLPVYEFSEDDIVGGGIKVTNQSTSGYYNCVETTFKNVLMDEQEDIYTLPSNTATDPTIVADGYLKSKQLDMAYVKDIDAVRSLTNRELARSQFQKQIDFDVDLQWLFDEHGISLSIYDVISVRNEHYGWGYGGSPSKKFRITSMKKSVDSEKLNVATISCMEYGDIFGGTGSGNVGNKKNPLPPMTAPVNVVFNQTTYITSGYGELTWQNTDFDPNLQSHVEYKLQSDATWTRLGTTTGNVWKVQNLRSDDYIFRVRSFHTVRGTSDWTESATYTISPSVIFPEVTGAVCNTDTVDFQIQWDDMLSSAVANPVGGVDTGGSDNTVGTFFSHYLVTIYHRNSLDSGWDYKAQYVTAENRFDYLYATNVANGLNRKIRAEVQIVARDGTKSTVLTTGASVDAENPQHSQTPLSQSEVSSELGIVNFTWTKSNERDFVGTKVYISDTNGFTPDVTNEVKDTAANFYTWIFPSDVGDGEIYYARIGSYDAFGTVGMQFSGQVALAKTTVDALIPDVKYDFERLRSKYGLEPADPERTQIANLTVATFTNPDTGDLVHGYKHDTASAGTLAPIYLDEYVVEEMFYHVTDNKTHFVLQNTDSYNGYEDMVIEVGSNTATLAHDSTVTNSAVYTVSGDVYNLTGSVGSTVTVLYRELAQVIGEPEWTAKAVDGNTVSAIGLITDEPTNRSDALIAADRLLVGAGGHPTWKPDSTYSTGDRVIYQRFEDGYEWDYSGKLTVGDDGAKHGFINVAGDQLYGAMKSAQYKNLQIVEFSSDATESKVTLEDLDGNPFTTPASIWVEVSGIQNEYVRTGDDYVYAGVIFSASDLGSEFVVRMRDNSGVLSYTNVMATAIIDVPVGIEPITANAAYWRIDNDNIDQPSFYHDSMTGKLILETATIETLHGDKIFANTIQGDKIIANSIEGEKISSYTTITAGTGGTNLAAMSGVESQGFWAGSDDPNSAPYRVSRAGALVATDADIKGDIKADSGYFKGDLTGCTGTFSGSLNVKSATTGERMEITDTQINVYDASNALRVRIGRL